VASYAPPAARCHDNQSRAGAEATRLALREFRQSRRCHPPDHLPAGAVAERSDAGMSEPR
jgi:hypothetical protein